MTVYPEDKPVSGEREAPRLGGFSVLLTLLAIIALAMLAEIVSAEFGASIGLGFVAAGLVTLVLIVVATGFVVVNPNEAKVIQFFGRYVGSIAQPGFYATLPLTERKAISLRIRNFETSVSKVNDADGNPIEIAAVVVYKVVDSYEAAFAVDDYENFVQTQSEAAVRFLATAHPYDAHDQRISLRDGATVAQELTAELQDRTDKAGIEVIEARITHLAYAPEIAQAMLVRQQAAQVVAARRTIVEGAVGMVQIALDDLSKQGVVELDEDRKATMVSNLLVVLCGDRPTQPVVNTGGLYS